MELFIYVSACSLGIPTSARYKSFLETALQGGCASPEELAADMGMSF